jgi:hypothetical protein
MSEIPVQARPATADLSLGHIFGRAWDIFSANLLPFFIIAAVISLPNSLLLVGTDPAAPPGPGFGWRVFAGVLFGLVLNMIAQAMILYIAFQYLRGQPASMGDAVQKGLARFLPILGVIILYSLGAGVGFLLLIIPGIILMIRWSVALPACVVEGLGPVASLGRSANLTKGYRWKIFGIFLLMWLASILVGSLIGLLSDPFGLTATFIANFVWNAVWAAYYNSVLVMTYHDLRVAKEGIDTDQIAAVFD